VADQFCVASIGAVSAVDCSRSRQRERPKIRLQPFLVTRGREERDSD